MLKDLQGREKLQFVVTASVTFTLCLVVVVAVVGSLMIALFHEAVDNAEIFKLIGPAFQTIIGGFIGLLAGIKLGGGKE